MSKQRINSIDKNGKRRTFCLDTDTGIAHSPYEKVSLNELEKRDPEGIGFFETCKLGKIIQRIGRFKGE